MPIDKKLTSVQDGFFYASAGGTFHLSSTREKFLYSVELLTIPRLNVSCNDRRGVDYATTLTQALLQVLASYSMQRCFPIPTS